MVNEAEKYKGEGKQQDEIYCKNSMESYAFNMKPTVEDEKLRGKMMMMKAKRRSWSAIK